MANAEARPLWDCRSSRHRGAATTSILSGEYEQQGEGDRVVARMGDHAWQQRSPLVKDYSKYRAEHKYRQKTDRQWVDRSEDHRRDQDAGNDAPFRAQAAEQRPSEE